jgi:hypothetical protein
MRNVAFVNTVRIIQFITIAVGIYVIILAHKLLLKQKKERYCMELFELENWICEELNILRDAGATECCLVHDGRRLKIIQKSGHKPIQNIIFIFDSLMVFEGLTFRQWDEVSRLVLTKYQEFTLCKTVNVL